MKTVKESKNKNKILKIHNYKKKFQYIFTYNFFFMLNYLF